jgi:hypothetical protein
VTIYIGTDSPGQDKEPNWLPPPAGNFRPILGMYQPRNKILNGTYLLPPINKITPR